MTGFGIGSQDAAGVAISQEATVVFGRKRREVGAFRPMSMATLSRWQGRQLNSKDKLLS